MLAAAPDSTRRSGGAPAELWLTAGWFVALLPSKRCERFDEATGVSFLAPNLLSGARLCTEGSQFGAAQNATAVIDTLASAVKRLWRATRAPGNARGTRIDGIEKVRVHAAAHKIWLASRSRAASAQP